MSLIRTAGRVAVATSVHGKVQRRQQQRFSAQDQQAELAAQQQQQAAVAAAQQQAAMAAAQQPAAPQAAAGADMEAKLAQLAQLDQLRASGALSQAEFDAMKTRILLG